MIVYVYAVMLTLVSLLCWVGILFGLPGTWLIVLFPVLLIWGTILKLAIGVIMAVMLAIATCV